MSMPTSGPDDAATTPDPVSRARDLLAARAARRWVEVSDDVLGKLLRTSRRSLPVLVHEADQGERTFVSEQVIVARLRQRVDEGMRHAATSRVHLDVSRDRRLQQVTIELIVEYGASLVDVGDEARRLVGEELASLTRNRIALLVRPSHVHIGDVVEGSPHVSDPRD